MDYPMQLLQKEWKLKRMEILTRDNYKCKRCLKPRIGFRIVPKEFEIQSYREFCSQGFIVSKTDQTKKMILVKNMVSESIFPGLQIPVEYFGDRNITIKEEKLNFCVVPVEQIKQKKNELKLFCFYDKQDLFKGFIDLNIHHKYYIFGNMAWEYENDALITLCIDCHKAEHANHKIPIYNKKGEKLANTTVCEKCDGAGFIPEYYYHKKGVCFRCFGKGVIF